jgi:tetratricopeptide (TPR) repeat protein
VKRHVVPALVAAAHIFIFPGTTAVCAEGPGQDAAQVQADFFLAKAAALLSSNTIAGARSMIASALELAPEYSETLYLRARLELADRSTTAAGIQDLRAALRNASWRTTQPAIAEQALAEALLRTGNLPEARALLQRLVAAYPERSGMLLLLARVYARAHDAGAEEKALADAAVRFPAVDEFRLLSADHLLARGRRGAAVDAVATGLKVHPDSLSLLLAAARLETDARRRTAAVERYLQKGGRDPESAVMGLESSPKDRAMYLGLFIDQNGLARQELVDRAVRAAADVKELKKPLQDALAGFSGPRDLDSDSDGYWEDRWAFEKGMVVGWTREPSQDGMAQYAAEFSAGQPSALTYSGRTGDRISLRYSRYPFVDAATVSPGGASLPAPLAHFFPAPLAHFFPAPLARYFIVPYSLQSPFLLAAAAGAMTGLAPRIVSSVAAPTLEQLVKAAFRLEEYSADGRVVARRTELSRGMKVYMEEDTDLDGSIDHAVWYSDGEPVKGKRSLKGDGVFQVTELWERGALKSEAVDADGNGRVDFRQVYGAAPVKSWDYDEDGRDDSRERPGRNGTVVREFSTAHDGVFDLLIELDGPRIAGITSGGAPVRIDRDPARGVTWIGGPAAAGERPELSLPDGLQVIGGKRFLVFRHGGVVYAQATR